jgi:hypothetical protein
MRTTCIAHGSAVTEQQPDWRYEELDFPKQEIHIVTPAGYIFAFAGVSDILLTLSELVHDSVRLNTTLYHEIYDVMGNSVCVFDADPWLNPNAKRRDYICDKRELALKLTRFLEIKWKKLAESKSP